jgi:hypothetical protein
VDVYTSVVLIYRILCELTLNLTVGTFFISSLAVLATMSVKFYVSKLFGTPAPKGAEGIMAVMDSPGGKKLMETMGIDPAEFKEIRG